MQCLAKFDQAAIRITKSFVNAFVRRSNQSGTVLVLTRDHPSAATLAALTSMTTSETGEQTPLRVIGEPAEIVEILQAIMAMANSGKTLAGRCDNKLALSNT